jgi:hypothetical protein
MELHGMNCDEKSENLAPPELLTSSSSRGRASPNPTDHSFNFRDRILNRAFAWMLWYTNSTNRPVGDAHETFKVRGIYTQSDEEQCFILHIMPPKSQLAWPAVFSGPSRVNQNKTLPVNQSALQ